MSVPRIAVDVRALQRGFKSHAGRGIGRYVRSLLEALVALDGSEGIGFLADEGAELGRFPPPGRVVRIGAPPWTERFGAQAVHARQHWVWPQRLPELPFDLFHFCSQTDAPASLRVPYVVSVLDLIPHRLEALYARGKSKARYRLARWLERRALRGARGLLAISEFTKKDVVELVGIPPARVVVTPLGIDERFRPPPAQAIEALRRRLQLRPPYLLYVGGIDRRKNVERLLDLTAHLLDKRDVELVLAGGYRDDPDYPALVARIHALGLERSVRLVGFVADDELPALYAGAAAFVYPSAYEGFGLPPLEAMACGAPVVAARRTSLPEVLGDAARLVDPDHPIELEEAVTALLDRPESARALGEAGARHALSYRWERTARLTLEAYREFSRAVSGDDNAPSGGWAKPAG